MGVPLWRFGESAVSPARLEVRAQLKGLVL